MKITAYISMTVLLASLSGCSILSRPGLSADGLSADYLNDASNLARVAADELARRYPPAHTQLTLTRVPGAFGEALENDLRTRGYAVAEDTVGALGVQYTVDELPDAHAGYVRIRLSDGQEFSFMRKLGMMMAEAPLELMTLDAPPVKTSLTPERERLEMPVSDTSVVSTSIPSSVSPIPAPVVPYAEPVAGTSTRLANGVLSSLPPSWRYTIPQADRRSVRVSKPDNLSWRERIQNMAEQAGCAASFDEAARRVTIIAYDDAPEPAVAPVVPSSTARLFLPASPALAALPRSPEPSSASVVTPSTPAAVSSALQDVSELPPLMAEPDNISILASPPSTEHGEQWVVNPGSLFTQLTSWCDRAGYQLVWKASHDLDMEAHAIFRGSFTEVIGRLFQGLHKSGNALRVTLYTANSVMEISEE